MVARRALTLALLSLAGPAAWSASLTPSRPALLRQVEGARGLAFAEREADIRSMAAAGSLVRVEGNGDYELKSSNPWPYARPELARFLADLGRGYREACGEALVVTSLVRPRNRQPRNASPLSVHPTGTAVDLRMHWRRACRSWLESELSALEDAGVLEAGRELHPPHYHVALFPAPYLAHLGEAVPEVPIAVVAVANRPPAGDVEPLPPVAEYRYVVQRGDTLWSISRRYGTEPATLRVANGLSSSTLRVGQQLRVPVGGAPAPGAQPAVYRVRPGDNLWRIARQHGTEPRDIQRANGLSSTRIFPGQVLQLPGPG